MHITRPRPITLTLVVFISRQPYDPHHRPPPPCLLKPETTKANPLEKLRAATKGTTYTPAVGHHYHSLVNVRSSLPSSPCTIKIHSCCHVTVEDEGCNWGVVAVGNRKSSPGVSCCCFRRESPTLFAYSSSVASPPPLQRLFRRYRPPSLKLLLPPF